MSQWDTDENGQERGLELDLEFAGASIGLRRTQPQMETSNDEYGCPVHGIITDVISFEFDGLPKEAYCMRCWRDHFRETFSQATPIERSPDRNTEEETNED